MLFVGLSKTLWRTVGLGVLLVLLLAPRLARAAGESDDDRKAAAKLFAEGHKAYVTGDYRHAAEAFEAAYRRAPRLPPLWNAARAWQKGGELVHAANLYAVYLRKAPPSAPDRNSATSALRDLETKLGRLEVHAADFTELKLDGAAIDLEDQDPSSVVVYVSPGSHVVEGQHAGKSVQQTATAIGGSSVSVVLLAPKEIAAPPPPPPPPPEKHSGWSPLVVAVGGGLTAVGLGLTIWSGLDTMSQRSTFDQAPTQANFDEGKAREVRTNVLLAVTAGVGVLTGIAAIFLVDWKGHAEQKTPPPATAGVRLHLGPGSALLEGVF
jgi:hypothetical protein